MPSKSRRRRSKHSIQSQKRKGTVARSSPARQTPAEEATTSSEVLASRESESTVTRKTATVRHPYITTELRTIGILSVIMLIILFVLARMLS